MNFVPIQLRLINAAGLKIDAIWAISTFTAERLPISISLPIASRTPRQPEISWTGTSWELNNQTIDACLFINGKPLPPRQKAFVHLGDTLEIGLCRFHLEAADRSVYEANHSEASTRSAASTGLYLDATPEAIERPTPPEFLLDGNRGASPDDDIFSLVPSPILEEPPDSPYINSETKPASEQAPDDPVLQLANDAHDDTEPTQEIRLLREAYLRALTDPDAALALKTGGVDRDFDLPLPPLPDDDPDLTLEEISVGTLHIDTLIRYFDDPGASHLLAPEKHEEILRLFAPEQYASHSSERRPPARTRQDHHAIGLDSSYRLSSQRAHPKAAPNTDVTAEALFPHEGNADEHSK